MHINLGSQLRKCRKIAGLTQVELAKKVGVDHTTISRYENDNGIPDPKTLQLFVTAFAAHTNPVSRDELDALWRLMGYEVTEILDAPVADPAIAYAQHVFEHSDPEARQILSEDLRTTIELDQVLIRAKKLNEQQKTGAAVEDLLGLRAAQSQFFQERFFRIDVELGHAYYGQGNFTQALLYYSQALWAAEETGNLAEGVILLRIGDTHRRLAQWDQALTRYREAEEIFQKLGDEHKTADCWRKQAGVYLFQGQPYQAEPLCHRSVEQCEKLDYTRGLEKGYQHIAWVLYHTGRWEEGIQHAEKALELVDNEWERIKALLYLGDACRLARDFNRAEQSYHEALTRLNDLEKEGVLVKLVFGSLQLGLGKLYLKLPGRQREAGECFNEGLKVQSVLGEDFRVADFLGEQGAFLLKRGRFAEAEMKLHMACERFLKAGNIYHYVNTLVSYCALYDARWEDGDPEKLFQTAEHTREQNNDQGLLNFHLSRIEFFVGKAHLRQGRPFLAAEAWCTAAEQAVNFNALALEELADDISKELLQTSRQTGVEPALQIIDQLAAFYAEKLTLEDLDARRKATLQNALDQLNEQHNEVEALKPIKL